MRSQVIFLDRDGVINRLRRGDYVKCWSEFEFLPGSVEAIVQLSQAGYGLIVITNQAGIGRGYMTEADLQQIHERMLAHLRAAGGEVMAIYYCPHAPEAHCSCRKPKPGMLLQAAVDWQLDLDQTLLIGDSLKDIQAGKAVGCETILVQSGDGIPPRMDIQPDHIFADLAQAAQWILHHRGKGELDES